jgi:hypothetical protein
MDKKIRLALRSLVIGLVTAVLVGPVAIHAQTELSPLERYTPRGTLLTTKPPRTAPMSVRATPFISVPDNVDIGDFDSFFAWFVPTFQAILPTDGEQPLRQGWQTRGSHVRIYRDRIEIDAPVAPAIGSRVMWLCRMVVPITDPVMRGHIVDAGGPGHGITQGMSPCLQNADAYRVENLRYQISGRNAGGTPKQLTPVRAIDRKGQWRGTIVLAPQFALEYGLIEPLRLVQSSPDPVALSFEPIDYNLIRTIDPIISHAFYGDGQVVSVVTYGLPEAAQTNRVLVGCVVFSRDGKTMLDRDPAVLSWCKGQIDAALPAVDKLVAASRISLPAPPPPPAPQK